MKQHANATKRPIHARCRNDVVVFPSSSGNTARQGDDCRSIGRLPVQGRYDRNPQVSLPDLAPTCVFCSAAGGQYPVRRGSPQPVQAAIVRAGLGENARHPRVVGPAVVVGQGREWESVHWGPAMDSSRVLWADPGRGSRSTVGSPHRRSSVAAPPRRCWTPRRSTSGCRTYGCRRRIGARRSDPVL